MVSVTYSSTRGGQSHIDFRTVVMQGLAHDKGLFVPDNIPAVTKEELSAWRSLSFVDLAVQVIRKFVQEDQVPLVKLQDIVKRSCAAFRHEDVTPVVQVGGHAILELFHGPTFAFKDVALQMLGNFFEYFLESDVNGGRLTVLGATSGDTGSAAMAGLRGKRGVTCVILFPEGRVSPRQELQMTTVPDPNVFAVAVQDATFDDCQDIVKACFNTPDFRSDVHLGAVNSINWCRVLAQTTYYFWSYLRMTDTTYAQAVTHESMDIVHFSVPTGNFGDVLAGYYAKCMGLHIGQLIVATNENDILHRFFTTGAYHRESIQDTISPSMDICVSSNFERYLFHLSGNDPVTLQSWMNEFECAGQLTVSPDLLLQAQHDFLSARVDTAETLSTIAQYQKYFGYVLCPHSAVGVKAAEKLNLLSANMVCLATAHEAKFPAAVQQALGGADHLPEPPAALKELESKPIRRYELPNNVAAIQQFVRERLTTPSSSSTKKESRDIELYQQWQKPLLIAAVAAGVTAIAIQVFRQRR